MTMDAASLNQSPIFEDIDLFATDTPLREAVERAQGDAGGLSAFGADFGSAATLDLGRLANEHPPRLRLRDAKGNRLDTVEFHPAYHALMTKSMAAGIHGACWQGGADAARGQVTRAARLYMAAQAEAGHLCPVSMTHASVAALAHAPGIAKAWLPKITARAYDPAFKPWWEKDAVTLGMGMTERQGGSDVRSNATRAARHGEDYEITGEKWFMSAPMCDAFLVLAQAEAGLTCFLMPRFRPDGDVNAIHFQRLKDKLGNRSNASSEVVFDAAFAQRVGDEGGGVRTIIDMVHLTRLDCAISSAGLMRMGLAHAVHHTRHRSAFQRRLADQPAMRAVLADLALQAEAHVALVFALVSASEAAATDKAAAAFARLVAPAAKYLVCKSAPGFLYECMECLGGNGYVEETPLARLYREAPVNAIWEGSGNVMALDVLRAARRAPEAAQTAVRALGEAAPDGRAAASALIDMLGRGDAERHARTIAEKLAHLAAAAALAAGSGRRAAAYVATRLAGSARATYGACDLGGLEEELLERAL